MGSRDYVYETLFFLGGVFLVLTVKQVGGAAGISFVPKSPTAGEKAVTGYKKINGEIDLNQNLHRHLKTLRRPKPVSKPVSPYFVRILKRRPQNEPSFSLNNQDKEKSFKDQDAAPPVPRVLIDRRRNRDIPLQPILVLSDGNEEADFSNIKEVKQTTSTTTEQNTIEGSDIQMFNVTISSYTEEYLESYTTSTPLLPLIEKSSELEVADENDNLDLNDKSLNAEGSSLINTTDAETETEPPEGLDGSSEFPSNASQPIDLPKLSEEFLTNENETSVYNHTLPVSSTGSSSLLSFSYEPIKDIELVTTPLARPTLPSVPNVTYRPLDIILPPVELVRNNPRFDDNVGRIVPVPSSTIILDSKPKPTRQWSFFEPTPKPFNQDRSDPINQIINVPGNIMMGIFKAAQQATEFVGETLSGFVSIFLPKNRIAQLN